MNAGTAQVDEEQAAAPRRAEDLLASVAAGKIPTEVTPSEIAALKKLCRQRTDAFLGEIERRLIAGDLRAARHKLHKYIKRPAAHLHATFTAAAKRKASRRPRTREQLSVAQRLDPAGRRARPRVHTLAKNGGGRRDVFSLGLEDSACAVLISLALKVFARAHPQLACHPAQVMIDGGSPVACERLRHALGQAPQGAVFVHIDIKSFYSSVAAENLARITGLPQEIVHRHLSVGHLNVHPSGVFVVSPGEEIIETHGPSGSGGAEARTALSGVPTGSAASSIAAEMVMGDVLRDAGALPGVLQLIAYSDNIGAVVRSQEEALAVKEAVLGSFRSSRAGPFSPSKVDIRAVASGFNFLGYKWRVGADGEVRAKPMTFRHGNWVLGFHQDLQYALAAHDLPALQKLRQRLRSYVQSKREWDGWRGFLAKEDLSVVECIWAACEAAYQDPAVWLTAEDFVALSRSTIIRQFNPSHAPAQAQPV